MTPKKTKKVKIAGRALLGCASVRGFGLGFGVVVSVVSVVVYFLFFSVCALVISVVCAAVVAVFRRRRRRRLIIINVVIIRRLWVRSYALHRRRSLHGFINLLLRRYRDSCVDDHVGVSKRSLDVGKESLESILYKVASVAASDISFVGDEVDCRHKAAPVDSLLDELGFDDVAEAFASLIEGVVVVVIIIEGAAHHPHGGFAAIVINTGGERASKSAIASSTSVTGSSSSSVSASTISLTFDADDAAGNPSSTSRPRGLLSLFYYYYSSSSSPLPLSPSSSSSSSPSTAVAAMAAMAATTTCIMRRRASEARPCSKGDYSLVVGHHRLRHRHQNRRFGVVDRFVRLRPLQLRLGRGALLPVGAIRVSALRRLRRGGGRAYSLGQ